MAILTPCLFMAAIGLVFCAIHLLSGKDGEAGDRPFGCSGLGCAGCAKPCERDGDPKQDA